MQDAHNVTKSTESVKPIDKEVMAKIKKELDDLKEKGVQTESSFVNEITVEKWQQELMSITGSEKEVGEKTNSLFEFLKKYRTYNLVKLQNIFSKNTREFNFEDSKKAQEIIANLQRVATDLLDEEKIESLIDFAQKSGDDNKVSKIVSNLVFRVLNRNLQEIEDRFLDKTTPTPEVNFDIVEQSLESNILISQDVNSLKQKDKMRSASDANKALEQKRKEFEGKRKEIEDKLKELENVEKNNKKFWRRIFNRQIDEVKIKDKIEKIKGEIAKLQKEMTEIEEKLEKEMASSNDAIRKSLQDLKNLQKNKSVVMRLRQSTLGKQDNFVESVNKSFQNFIRQPEIDNRLREERIALETKKEKQDIVKTQVGEVIKQKVSAYLAIKRGDASRVSNKVDQVFSAIDTIAGNVPIPGVAQVLTMASAVGKGFYDKRKEKQYEKVAKFMTNLEKAEKIFDKVSDKIAAQYGSAIEMESAEDFSKGVANLILKAVKSGDVTIYENSNIDIIDENLNIDEKVEEIMKYLSIPRNQNAIIGKVKINVESKREKATLQGMINHQAVKITIGEGEDKKEVVMVHKSRLKDLELGHKYGIRELPKGSKEDVKHYLEKGYVDSKSSEKNTNEEQDGKKKNNKSAASLKQESGPEKEQQSSSKLTNKTKELLEKLLQDVFIQNGADNKEVKFSALKEQDQQGVLREIEGVVKKIRQGGKIIDLKYELAGILKKGARGPMNIADNDRAKFNKVKNFVAKIAKDPSYRVESPTGKRVQQNIERELSNRNY